MNTTTNAKSAGSKMGKREFLKKLGLGSALAVGAPYLMGAKKPIR